MLRFSFRNHSFQSVIDDCAFWWELHEIFFSARNDKYCQCQKEWEYWHISNADFSLNIGRGCDAVSPTILFLGAILVYPTAFANKWKALLIAPFAFALLNLIRIVSLFLLLFSTNNFRLMFYIFDKILCCSNNILLHGHGMTHVISSAWFAMQPCNQWFLF